MEKRKVDSQGRISLPPKWREKVLGDTGEVYIFHEGETLIIKPKREPNLTKYFDSVTVDVGPEEFEDYHRLKKALLRGR